MLKKNGCKLDAFSNQIACKVRLDNLIEPSILIDYLIFWVRMVNDWLFFRVGIIIEWYPVVSETIITLQ